MVFNLIEMKILNTYLKYSCMLLVLLFSVFSNGQTRGTRISDNSDGKANSGQGLHEFAILDLKSFEKGFLLPRMSTSQRDAINVDKSEASKDGGLIIFNTSTDCINYYNYGSKSWVSLCGDILPANFSILPNQCDELKLLGTYYQGRELDGSNGIVLNVNVAKAGLYDIIISTDNDYGFETKGVFPDTGVYQIFVKGDGKPKMGHKRDLDSGEQIEKGDKLTIKLNGEASGCDNNYVFVEKPMPKFKIIDAIVHGEYMNGVEVDDFNKITVTVDVEQDGKLVLFTTLTNGIEFKGEKVVTKAGEATVEMKAIGVPDTNGQITLNIFGNSEHKVGNQPAPFPRTLEIKQTDFEIIDCDSIVTEGEAAVNKHLTSVNKLKVKVKVNAPGPIKMIATDVNGDQNIRFESDVILLDYNKNGESEQIVELVAVAGTPKESPITKLKFSAEGLSSLNTCTAELPVTALPLDFKLVGKPKLLSGEFISTPTYGNTPYVTPRTKMPDNGSDVFGIEVFVEANSIGNYDISTQKINGVEFKAHGAFTKEDVTSNKVRVVLKAYGTSESDLYPKDAEYELATNSDVAYNENMKLQVDFVYRPMQMYSIGTLAWHPGGKTVGYNSGPDLVKNANHFGWNGVVRIASLKIVGANSGNFNNRSAFITSVRNSDMIFIGGRNYTKDSFILNWIEGQVSKRGLAVVYGESPGSKEQMGVFLKNFDNDFSFNPSKSNVSASNTHTLINTQSVAYLENNLFSDRFFKKYSDVVFGKESLHGFPISSGIDGGFTLDQVPDDFEAIAYETKSPSRVFAMAHKNLGLITVFGGGFMGGKPGRKDVDYPLYATDGTDVQPRLHPSYSPQGYNSFFLLSLVHWAIDYAQEHQDNKPSKE